MFKAIAKVALTVLCTVDAAGGARAEEQLNLTRKDGDHVIARASVAGSAAACAPLAVLSPGAGGSDRGLANLAGAFHSWGWTTVVVGHKESSLPALRERVQQAGLKGGLLEMVSDAEVYRARLLDYEAVLAWQAKRCDAPARILVGHSLGAASTLIEAGARNQLGITGGDRFDAYIALSMQGVGAVFPVHAWNGIRAPVLLMTGTQDKALEGDWEARAKVFDDLNGACKSLVVIDGATHMNLGGYVPDARMQTIIDAAIRTFAEGVRKGACRLPAKLDGMTVRTK